MLNELNKKRTIVLIDDTPLMHKIINRTLGEEYDLAFFTSGREAVSKLDEIKPDLILLDVEMPDLDGFETIKLIKHNENMADVPVIFLTAKNDVEFELRALSLGAIDYINKPFSNQLLTKRVEIHINQTVQKRELANFNENLQEMVREKTKVIKELQYAIVFALADLVEMRDHFTGGHILRTQEYFKLILDYLAENNIYQDALKEVDATLLLEASQLHDIGKVAIPDAILLKPARLAPEEFNVMKTHTTIGYNAVRKAMELTSDREFLSIATQIALFHHEKWDGTGYPHKLKGENIPLFARIMAIVDVYDALVSKRHYKEKMDHKEAMKILVEGRGTHFDPILVDTVVNINEKFAKISQNNT